MRGLKKPMANAIYVALITAIYAAIFIASSEFVTGYDNLLSNSWWAAFIKLQNMKFLSLIVLIFAPVYFVETIFALIFFQWVVMMITELWYLITNYKI